MATYAYTQRLAGQNQAFFVDVTGLETLEELFDKFPAKYSKAVIISIFRKAGGEYNKVLKSNLPPRLKQVSKIIKTKPGRGRIESLSAGPFAKLGTFENRYGKKWDLYQLLYWSNYGTLENRDSSHYFKEKRRRVSADWKGGIIPIRFAEKSYEQTKGKMEQIINNDMQDVAVKHLEKYKIA